MVRKYTWYFRVRYSVLYLPIVPWTDSPVPRPSVWSVLVYQPEMAKKKTRNGAADASMGDAGEPAQAHASDAKPRGVGEGKPSNKRKSIAKLSRKQKIRKQRQKDRGEARVDQASAKSVKFAKKLHRRLSAKTLW